LLLLGWKSFVLEKIEFLTEKLIHFIFCYFRKRQESRDNWYSRKWSGFGLLICCYGSLGDFGIPKNITAHLATGYFPRKGHVGMILQILSKIGIVDKNIDIVGSQEASISTPRMFKQLR
jgi:hypothetical protein